MKPALTVLSAALIANLGTQVHAQEALEFSDVFDFKYPKATVLGEQGKVLAFSAAPYRGDAQGLVYDLESNTLLASVERGTQASINKNSQWAAFLQVPSLLEKETADKKAKKKLKNTLVLVNTQSGEQQEFAAVKDYQISDDGRWLAYRHEQEENKANDKGEETDAPANGAESSGKTEDAIKADKKDKVLELVVVDLNSGVSSSQDAVLKFAFSHTGAGLLFNTQSKDGSENEISYLDLNSGQRHVLIDEPGVTLSTIDWHPMQNLVAFNVGNYVNDDQRRRDYRTMLWHVEQNKLQDLDSQWQAGKKGTLSWSEDGERLYFTARPTLAAKPKELKYQDAESLHDYDTIMAQAKLNLWHHQDAEIKPREEQQWGEENKHRHYQAVYHLDGNKVVQLADAQVPELNLNKKADHLLGYNNQDYLAQITYKGFYSDYYAIDVLTGNKQLIVAEHPHRPSLSPTGKHAVFFDKGVWQLKDLGSNKVRPLSKAINAIFADDQHDYPSPVSDYGVAGWYRDGSKVLINSKHDIWAFDTRSGEAQALTQGKANNKQYRVINLDSDKLGFNPDETLLLRVFDLKDKQAGVAQLKLADKSLVTLLDGDARFDLVKKAKHAEKYLFTQQSYSQFPDFWQADKDMANAKQVTDLNPQIDQFKWGKKPELVSYKGYDGEDLQGVLIKPADYVEGKKVPVVIYFYRYMSQRRYDFPKMELNHRPNFPMFTSNGYAIFLPDIRFEVGHPGPSSTKTMINAAQKLIDMGVADPDAIGLQGHSWAGYQSAFMVTQTDMFKAVVSGAPVSNMTSAYSGIRLKSGLARQFQYETGQSRIGKPLYEAPELYIENSPVFFADKVNTPIMVMFGNEDGAVPWQEGIQYYLALRRAGKDVILLEYEGEPHHLKQFPNQVDFSIRMMQYFDHHLKGKAAPQWMQEGIPFYEE
ncbi:S9 family peptidase [Pseudoalteromonas sp. T1lg10]|uniref:S9 family peptidase n=1 Tax=Pseudoalteromonas sp. T1lg10 TaxID=2077093 RepID=UPI000CF6253E|nr:prolyl oligopeptidase family serine peptidase [Pseudoalteromonas sp. T1lg10]